MKNLTTKLIFYALVAIPIFVSCENNDPTSKAEDSNSRIESSRSESRSLAAERK